MSKASEVQPNNLSDHANSVVNAQQYEFRHLFQEYEILLEHIVENSKEDAYFARSAKIPDYGIDELNDVISRLKETNEFLREYIQNNSEELSYYAYPAEDPDDGNDHESDAESDADADDYIEYIDYESFSDDYIDYESDTDE